MDLVPHNYGLFDGKFGAFVNEVNRKIHLGFERM